MTEHVIEAFLHDGTILEFPLETSEAVIERTVRSQLGLQDTAGDTGLAAKTLDTGEPLVSPGVDPGLAEDVIAVQPREGLPGATAGFGNRDVFVGAGGIAGGVLAAPVAALTGPFAPAVILGGGAAGAAAGSLLFDTFDDVVRFFEGTEKERGIFDPSLRALEAAKTDALFTGGALSLGPLIRAFKPLVGRAMGLKDKARLADLAEAQGIKIGAIQATKSLAIKGFATVLGVFPFINPPLIAAAKASGRGTRRFFNDLLNTMAPTVHLADLGVDMTRVAGDRFKNYKRMWGALYLKHARLAARASDPAFLPTKNTASTAKKLFEEAESGRTLLKTGKVLTSPRGVTDPLQDFINQLKDLPDRITVKQLRKMQRELGEATAQAKADGFDIKRGRDLKRALERDLNSPDLTVLTQKEGEEIVKSLTRANQFFAETMKQFETTTAGRFAKADKNIFKPGFFKAGSLNADEIAKDVFNAQSPMALKDLRRLVGGNQFKRVARKHIDDVAVKSFDESAEGVLSFNPDSFVEKLGLNTAAGRESVEEMIRGTGVNLKDLDDFVEMARAAEDFTISSSATFLKRKFTLTAFRGIGSAAAFTASLADPITTITAIFLLRHGGRILTRPSTLRNLTRAMDDTLTKQLRRTAITRVAVNVLRGPDNRQELEKRTAEGVDAALQLREATRAPGKIVGGAIKSSLESALDAFSK